MTHDTGVGIIALLFSFFENYLRYGACSRHHWTWILTDSWTLRTSFPCSYSWTSLGCSSSSPSDYGIYSSTWTWILTPVSPLLISISSCLHFLAPWTRSWRSPSRCCLSPRSSSRLCCQLISAASQLCGNLCSLSCPAVSLYSPDCLYLKTFHTCTIKFAS